MGNLSKKYTEINVKLEKKLKIYKQNCILKNLEKILTFFLTFFRYFILIFFIFQKIKLAISSHLITEFTIEKYSIKFGLLMANQ